MVDLVVFVVVVACVAIIGVFSLLAWWDLGLNGKTTTAEVLGQTAKGRCIVEVEGKRIAAWGICLFEKGEMVQLEQYNDGDWVVAEELP